MSFLLETLRLGLSNLRLHLLRSVLTSLGIILGVGAVIVMVAIGEGNKQAALRDIQSLGATNIIVRSDKPPEANSYSSQERSFILSYGITRSDLRRVRHFLPDAAHIVPLKSVGDEMSFRAARLVSQAYGTTPELLDVAKLRISRGRYLTTQDDENRSAVAVIGDQVARQLFPLREPLGEELRIGDRLFRIIGVLSPVGLAGGRGAALVGRDLNKDVHIPIKTAELMFGDVVVRRQSGSFSGERVEISEIYVTAPSTGEVLQMAQRVRRVIENIHADTADAEVIVPWELLESEKKTQLVWNIVLISIAAISLLVGGIGIMNIMLASVTERTREIGIRRALGATRRHIVAQFLVETGSLSAVGGLLGIALGVSLSLAIGRVLPWFLKLAFVQRAVETQVNLETQVTAWSIAVSFAVATAVGLIFGIYPALVASRQDPIVALRHD
jgi:putative ABC transport system permease protein